MRPYSENGGSRCTRSSPGACGQSSRTSCFRLQPVGHADDARVHSQSAPFFIVDCRHYWGGHTRPWWETNNTYYRRLGFIHIMGTWDNSLFGGEPTEAVSASQWMYDAAINSDGCWLWFEQEPLRRCGGRSILPTAASHGTERKVGQFLLRGAQSVQFAAVVEWTGDPEWERKLIQRTYSLGGKHLLHLHNVDTDRPAQVRVQFPHWLSEADGRCGTL